MSKLKAFDVILGQNIEDGCPCVVAVDADQNPRLLDEKVYLKSEADKVIAEKDEEIDELKERIDELQKATDSAWSKVNAMYDELRHNKYKRCLDKAKLCKRNRLHASVCGPVEKIDFYFRWHNRWLELAEKFKEAK